MSEPFDNIQPPGPQHGVKAANYGTPQNPARDNQPKPTTPRDITPPPFDPDASPADALIAQQWRDAVRLGLAANVPDSLNADGPGGVE